MSWMKQEWEKEESSKEEVSKNVRSHADITATLAAAPASHDGTSLTAQLASMPQAKDPEW